MKKTLEDIECVIPPQWLIKESDNQTSSFIQGRIQISKDLQQRKLAEEPTKGHEAIRDIQKVS